MTGSVPFHALGFGSAQWRKFAVIGLTCMTQVFPTALMATLVPTILRERGLPLETFWIFSLPYAATWLKFLWAPLVDQHGHERFGLRKSWIVPATLLGALTVWSIGLVRPDPSHVSLLAALLVVHTLVMTTQDIAVDAYTLENLEPGERAVGTGVKVYMEVLGELCVLAGFAFIYQAFGWPTAMLAAGLLLITLTIPVALRPEPAPPPQVRKRRAERRRPSLRAFVLRRDSRLIAPLLLAAGFCNVMLNVMAGAFLIDRGFSIAEVGAIMGLVVTTGGLAGVLLLSACLTSFSMRSCLAALVPLSIIAYLPLAWTAGQAQVGFATAAAAIFLPSLLLSSVHFIVTISRMGWASPAQAGTDFTIQGTLYNIGRNASLAIIGLLAARMGWTGYFLLVGGAYAAVTALFFFLLPRIGALVESRTAGLDPEPAASIGAPFADAAPGGVRP